MNKRIRVIGLMLIIWGLSYLGFAAYQLSTPLQAPTALLVSLEKGRPLSSFFTKLENAGVIKDSRFIMLLAKITGQSRQAKAGDYRLTQEMNSLDVLRLLVAGETVKYKITLVEGHNIKETLQRIAAHDKLIQDLPANIDQLMPFLGLTGHPEGRFFPDTYIFDRNTRASSILVRAQVRLEKVLAEQWQKKEEDLPYKSSYEALIMASIVEKETAAPDEREKIAGVFVRRLQKNMRLQTDPTVIYGLGDRYKGNIRRKHLREATPYNTYTIKGLPPTPISLVGKEAIYAALHPAEGEKLYFVAKGNGRHYFSSTLAEHNKAVREYQINKRKSVEEYRSTPDKK
ncbi:MAG: UPF0755 protein [Psychrobacter glaciei]|jgi:UPF0755 protein